MTLRDILEKRGVSMWLCSLEEAEEVVALVASTLSGTCRIKVMEQVDEEMLTFSMDESMTSLIDPVTGNIKVCFLLILTLLFLLLLSSGRDHPLSSGFV